MTVWLLVQCLWPRYRSNKRTLVEPWGRVRASVSCPAWLSSHALRRCRGRARRVRACRALGSAPTATGGPRFRRPAASVSYSPYARSQHPDYGDRPTAEQIRADLKLIAPYTRAIRTYSSTGGVEQVPGDRGRVRAEGHGRHLDRQERSAQRAGNPVAPIALARATATSTRSWSATRPSLRARRNRSTSSSSSSSASSGSARCRSRPAKPGTCGST